jgi:hypothetical protein
MHGDLVSIGNTGDDRLQGLAYGPGESGKGSTYAR